VSALASVVRGRIHVSEDGRRLGAAVDNAQGLATSVVRALDGAGVLVNDIEVRQPSLDDVFFSLTGGHIEEDDDDDDAGDPADTSARADRPALEGVRA
jgi:ABC-2 type transport system ATP-binding protein